MYRETSRRRKKFLMALMVFAVLVSFTLLHGCGGSSSQGNKVTLRLGAYTTPREAYGKAIIPAFKK